MIWKGLGVLFNTESPIVVVLRYLKVFFFVLTSIFIFFFFFMNKSGSMEPAFQRGDILMLTMANEPLKVGEICVFKLRGRDIPIVHRVLRVHDQL